MKKRQLNLFEVNVDLTHGGSKIKGRRKIARPLSSKKPIHLVLKAGEPFQLLRNIKHIEQTLKKYSQRFGIVLHEYAVHADHIHLSFTIPNRNLYCRWIRSITSVLVKKIQNLRWQLLPFTRIASWGRDFLKLCKYIQQNQTEGLFLLHAHERVDEYRNDFFANKAF